MNTKTISNNEKKVNKNNINVYEFISPKDMVLFLKYKKNINADIPDLEGRENRLLNQQAKGKDNSSGAYSNTVLYDTRFNASRISKIVTSMLER